MEIYTGCYITGVTLIITYLIDTVDDPHAGASDIVLELAGHGHTAVTAFHDDGALGGELSKDL